MSNPGRVKRPIATLRLNRHQLRYFMACRIYGPVEAWLSSFWGLAGGGGKRALGLAGLMRFRILGPLEVLSPNGWTAISAAKWRSLLACLLVQPGQLVSTDALIDELWGDSPPNTANNLVSIYVHRLRKLIGDSEGRVLVYRAHGYQLRLAPGDLDLGEFHTQVTGGSGALAAGEPERAAGLLGAALSLWRGPLLADVAPTPLLALQVDRAAELRLSATELRIEA
jgi:hypothetical protein